MASPRSIVRGILGAILGAGFGAIIMLMLAVILSSTVPPESTWILGLILMGVGIPVGLVVGAVTGARSMAGGVSSARFRQGAISAAELVAAIIILRIVLPDNRPKPDVDTDGCVISPQGAELRDSVWITVYDRYCPGAGGHTVNLSIAKTAVPILGPGNVLVLAVNESREGETRGTRGYIFATAVDSVHLLVKYNAHGRVVSQSSPVFGYEVEFRPDTGTH